MCGICGLEIRAQWYHVWNPTRAILWPLFFLLYTNDLANVSNVLFTILFADDSNLFISGDDPNDLANWMNNEMIKVIDWLMANKLTLNIVKTHFVSFRRQRNLANLTQSLIVNGQHIAQVKSTKFLGILIDEYLQWREHTKYVKGLRASSESLAVIHQPSYTVIITWQIHFLHYITFDFVPWILSIYSILEVLMILFNQWVNWTVCPCQAFRIRVLFFFSFYVVMM